MKKICLLIFVSIAVVLGAMTVSAYNSCGDVNGDGEVNATDLTVLMRYLGGWDGYEDLAVNTQIDSDDETNASDCVTLARYLANWRDYEILGPYRELGIPTASYYAEGKKSRCAWDLIYFNDKVYIGAGDFGDNTGPVPIYAYDTNARSFVLTGTVNDEEISRFVVIDGMLSAPGIDPYGAVYGWDYGNYFRINRKGKWEVVRSIPHGIHDFDMVENDGLIFVSTGTYSGEYPVCVSNTKGVLFDQVPFYKNGELLDTTVWTTNSGNIRVYDLFVLKGEVYALFAPTKDMYKHVDGVFTYVGTWSDKNYTYNRYSQKGIINDKTEFDGKYYLACGTFYITDDLINMTAIEIPEYTNITDVIKTDDRVYALGTQHIDSELFKISILANTKESPDRFTEVYSFNYSDSALSFTTDGAGNFYIGIGNKWNFNTRNKNGMILKVKIAE